MRKHTRDGKLSGRTRQCSCGIALLAVLAVQCAEAEPPATPASAAPTAAASTAAGNCRANTRGSGSRGTAGARSDFEARPFASADDLLPPHPRAHIFPATFSAVSDLRSRSYLQDLSIPTMGGDGHGIRDQSPTEQLIRQMKKEGMPLALLWQNDEALLSLGLNRKGKPGLWIIQKTP